MTIHDHRLGRARKQTAECALQIRLFAIKIRMIPIKVHGERDRRCKVPDRAIALVDLRDQPPIGTHARRRYAGIAK